MTDIKTLEKKVDELDTRLKKLEAEKDWTDTLYEKARALVVKNDRASAIFLQRKLMIDYERAERLLEKLQSDGVVGPSVNFEPRKVLVKE